MKCNEVPFGTGYCAYAIYLPWKVKFEWEMENYEEVFNSKTGSQYNESYFTISW